MEKLANRFVLERPLGAGGMGQVFLGRDEVLARSVAVKVLNPVHGDTDVSARFQREGRTAARLSHPNVVQVYDAGEGELEGRETPYIVMEYVRGGDLKGLIDKRGYLPGAELSRLGAEICAGLAHAHERGVIHRDIKPHNILLDERGHAKVTDFGIARALDMTQATRTGTYLGTAMYSAPEQLQGHGVTPKSDVYSLGATLYQTATGEPPFSGTPLEVASQHVARTPTPPRQRGAEIGGDLETLIMACLAKDPDDRPTADEARSKLEAAAPDTNAAPVAPPRAEPARPGRTRPAPPQASPRVAGRVDRRGGRRGALAVLAVLAVLGVVGALALPGLLGSGPDQDTAANNPAPTATRNNGGGNDAPNGGAENDGGSNGGSGGESRDRGSQDSGAQNRGLQGQGSQSQGSQNRGVQGSGGQNRQEQNQQVPAEQQPEEASSSPDSEQSASATQSASPQPESDQAGQQVDGLTEETAAQTVQEFYATAESPNYESSWNFLSSRYQQELGAPGVMTNQFQTLESVTFISGPTAEVNGNTATVSFSTIAQHTDHVDRPSLTATLVNEGGQWKIDTLG